MAAISLKIPEELIEASGRCAAALKIPRAEYIRRAIERMNRETTAKIRAKRLAEASKKKLLESGKFEEIHTEITAATTFYEAEIYHQDYYKKNPTHYNRYRIGSGRAGRLQQLWGDEKK